MSNALSFYRSQNVLCWSKFFVPDQKKYLYVVAVTNILGQTKIWFAFSNIGFCASTKFFEEALNAVKFLDWLKIFGPAQNILGPVKGQGITYLFYSFLEMDSEMHPLQKILSGKLHQPRQQQLNLIITNFKIMKLEAISLLIHFLQILIETVPVLKLTNLEILWEKFTMWIQRDSN